MNQPPSTRTVMLGDPGHGSAVTEIAAQDAGRLHSAALGLAAEVGDPAADSCESASVLASALPADLLRALYRFGNVGAPREALLVRGMLADAGGLGPTPGTVTPPPPGSGEQAAELTLLAAMSMLGEPFTFASLYGGRLVQHVTAVPGCEDAQTSEGSQADLEWHVEDAFSDDRCDYFGMLCLRGAPDAVTAVAAARNLRLPSQAEAVLRQPRFVIAPDLAHDADRAASLPPLALLSGPPGDPEFRFDAVYQRPADPQDAEAEAALRTLAGAISEAAAGHVMEPGDLLVIDNRRAAHARMGYLPRYDGAGRWVLRVMVCASGREHRRRGGIRVLPSASGK
ncbi:MAG: TauD/TfdA family dioxygenase [Trebonia sp.]